MTLLELLHDWLRDSVVSGLALVSLWGVVAVASTADEPVWAALGVLAGVVATVTLFVALAGHWSPVGTWLTMLVVACSTSL